MLRALTPTLTIGEPVVWRVPISIGFPDTGQIGTVVVDVHTGQLIEPQPAKVEIERHATKLTAHLPPYRPHKQTPVAYLAKDVSPAPQLILPE